MTTVARVVATGPFTVGWNERDLPPPGPGEVRVRTRLSAVSVASELSVVAHGPFPARLGYQTVGVVEATAPDTGLTVGQRVVTTLGHAAAGLHRAGHVIPVPDRISERVALAVILGEETHKGIRRVAPRPGDRVLVAGAGLLGLLTVFNLTRRGVADVTVLEPETERRALAHQFGAAVVAAPGDLPDNEFDVGFECSAAPAGFAALLSHLRPGGRACVLSDGNGGPLILPPDFHRRELTVVASSDGEDYATYARWLWTHAETMLETLFNATVRPAELPDLYRGLQAWPRPVSVVVDWAGGADRLVT